MNPQVIAARLRALRTIAWITQGELASRSGWSSKLISSWEGGRRTGSIKVSQLSEVIAVYGLSLTQFLGSWEGGVPKGTSADLITAAAQKKAA